MDDTVSTSSDEIDNLEENDENEEEEEEVKHPIASVIDEFVHSVLDIRECVERLAPIIIDQLNEQVDEINNKFDQGFELLENTKDSTQEIIAIKTIEEGRKLAKRYDNSNLFDTLIKSLFINLFSAFDKLTGSLLLVLYSKKPELFNTINKEVSLSEILQISSMDELKNSVLAEEIETLRRKSYIEQFKDLEKRFSINLTKFKSWPLFVEASQRRNLFTHCDGVVSQQYLKICCDVGHKENKDTKTGDKLTIEPQYFYIACTVVTEVGVMLGQTLWRKTLSKEIEDADNHLHRLIYDFLNWEDWGVAIRLSQFAKNLPNHSNEVTRRIIIINYAIALSAIEKKESAIKLVDKEDWSAMIPDFKLAVSVIKDDDDEAIKVMKQLGKSGEMIDELSYHEWPLFREFRNKECFLKAYNEIYGYPFIDKLNQLVEETRKENEEKNTEENMESSNNELNSDIQKLRDATHLDAG